MIKWSITAVLLGFVLQNGNLLQVEGINQLLSELTASHIHWLLASFALSLFMAWFSSLKWWYLSTAIGLNNAQRSLFRYTLIGKSFNLVLPSNIGGDVIRIRLQGKSGQGYALSAAAVFMDRYTGLVVLMGLASACLIYTSKFELPLLREAMGLTLAGLGLISWLLFHQRSVRALRRLIEPKLPLTQRAFTMFQHLQSKVAFYGERPTVFLNGLLLAAGFYLWNVLYFWLCLLAFDTSVPFEIVLLGVPLIMVIMNLPISVGGIGLAEFGFVVVFGAMGVAVETALAGVLLLRVHTLFLAGLGGLAYLTRRDPIPA